MDDIKNMFEGLAILLVEATVKQDQYKKDQML
jgi:hypothetical protein